MKQSKFLAIMATFFVFAFTTINASAQHNHAGGKMMKPDASQSGIPDYTAATPEAFQAQLGQAVQAYLPMKDAFTATDAEKAKAGAGQFLASLEKVGMELLKGDAHMYWMKQLKALKGHAESIKGSSDVEGQRKQFSSLTNALVESLTAFGTKGTVYLLHCPMAFNNEGANWLSAEKAVKNPYFGKKMLTCGTLKATFPLERKTAAPPAKEEHKHKH
jgi:membrane fusion protein, copper/silver efflux system